MEMISKSMQALLSQNSVIRAMFEEGERLRGEYGSDKVYAFSLGNPNVRIFARRLRTPCRSALVSPTARIS